MDEDAPRPGRIEVKCPKCDGYHPAPDDPAFDELLRTACVSVGASANRIYQEFQLAGPGGRWDTDDETGTIRWTHQDGTRVQADYCLAGSWIEASGSFMWGWALPHVTPATRGAAVRLREYGEKHGHGVLTTQLLVVDERDAWHLTNIAAHLSGLPGTYRAKVNDKAWAYFVFSEPSWEQ